MFKQAESSARVMHQCVGTCCLSAQSITGLKNNMYMAHEKCMYSWADLRGLVLLSVTLFSSDKDEMLQRWWLKPSEGSNYEMADLDADFFALQLREKAYAGVLYPFQSCSYLIFANAAWKHHECLSSPFLASLFQAFWLLQSLGEW